MAPRSRSGCLTCRQRKLKCGEQRPVCAQCAKANRECIPSSGITFRHQQNPSLNSAPAGEKSLKSFYGYRETFGQGVKWVKVPQNLTFVNTTNPYEDEGTETAMSGPSTGAPRQQRSSHQQSVDDEFASRLAALADNATRYQDAERPDGVSAFQSYPTSGLEALSAVASQDHYSYSPLAQMHEQRSKPAHIPSATSPSQHPRQLSLSQPNIGTVLDGNVNVTPCDSNIDPRLHTESVASTVASTASPIQQQTPAHVRSSSYSNFGRPRLLSKGSHLSRRPSIADPELAFLLRDFSERCGPWMDLFDLGLFFASEVPVLAVKCPLLLYSCVAASAKCLARVDGRKPVMNGQITTFRRSSMESWPGPPLDAEGWVHKARGYYDIAVSLLRRSLEGASARPQSADGPFLNGVLSRYDSLPTTDSDELVAATAILCVYEFLDASGQEWSRHLDGTKSLFDIANDRMVPLTIPPSPASGSRQQLSRTLFGSSHVLNAQRSVGGLSQGRRAVFWNFARQDMLSAFINTTSTRLDTADLPMWQNAGLSLTSEGFICPSNPDHPNFVPGNAMTDDLVSNALIWLLMKLINFIAAGDEVPESLSPLGLGIRQQELLDYWVGLELQLQAWYDGLPDSFHPIATVEQPSDGSNPPAIEERWFPRSLCASTMQSYHFARIQLLHNKPHLSTGSAASGKRSSLSAGSSLAARHASYASILQQSRSHAKEIVRIGLGRHDEAARIHSVQPLWTAGLVLGVANGEDGVVDAGTEVWRRSVISQLRGIERDMGWASEYRVQNLLELWDLPGDWGLEEDGAGESVHESSLTVNHELD